MTIFDTLRYPISIPPQKGELQRLPKKLYDYWLRRWDNIEEYDQSALEYAMISDWDFYWSEHNQHYIIGLITRSLEDLRQLIKDYNDDI